ncbi:hypothetical protein FAD_1772 [Ferroplasma acidiphilum]|nr:hypothetical protein FAD_1772 [Ferroplasma acidiphilum]
MNILKRILIKIERYTGSNVFKTVLILILIVLVGSYLE